MVPREYLHTGEVPGPHHGLPYKLLSLGVVERGFLGGILPPHSRAQGFWRPGEAGEKGGSGRGSAAPSVVVCLSVCYDAN